MKVDKYAQIKAGILLLIGGGIMFYETWKTDDWIFVIIAVIILLAAGRIIGIHETEEHYSSYVDHLKDEIKNK